MHTKDKLAGALREADLPELAHAAAQGLFDDWLSPLPMPVTELLARLADADTDKSLALRQRVIAGEFESTEEEAEAWAESPEGQATFALLGGPGKPGRPPK